MPIRPDERDYMAQINEAKEFVRRKISQVPELGIILGSGLGPLAEVVENRTEIPYREIPNFPVSTVEGHAGQAVFGRLQGKEVVVMQGRFHYYEGYSMREVTLPVRVMQVLGVKGLIVTNAAGGINAAYKPGDLVLIKDHINLLGDNPLRGANLDDLGLRFPDLSEGYDREWRKKALQVAGETGVRLEEGVYAAMLGPSYETPAEIRFLRTIGADLVGMSTVPEVIAANHGGMRVLGISCVTNMAAGVLPQKLSHLEVMETAERIEKEFVSLVQKIIRVL
ncbi:purine-nucleoside phosphorylase [Acididesulfobacillus acetoxydans]|uniref:Purine nucleoside phosphorylase n=2 Tax=Acididesulfobacillus acetoxydans TaxID=1561005 RepID=A0A8S0W8U4_9FIRM|nr:purine-nucleoside phosphorylase [Acididesulfobacillus acetoxydans]CAA7602089.1 purine-nucleoside phosphorylase [Acididesulfobacillus acetoxydans]CEJ08068.1 Purine nucleoside phosphorylase 1 [Acididesulfobacillus acetoxydans]